MAENDPCDGEAGLVAGPVGELAVCAGGGVGAGPVAADPGPVVVAPGGGEVLVLSAEGGGGRWPYARKAEGYGHLGLGRRTVFRWLAAGRLHADLPPFDEPLKLESWYLRMRERGVFTHRFPKEVAEKISGFGEPSCPDVKGEAVVAGPAPVLVPVVAPVVESPTAPVVAGPVLEEISLRGEVEHLERVLAECRRRAELWLGSEDEALLDKGRREAARALELLDKITVFRGRLAKLEESEGLVVRVADVERALGEVVPRVRDHLMQAGGRLYGLLPEVGVPRSQFLAAFRQVVAAELAEIGRNGLTTLEAA